ncbi:MAG TPA: hypothetical protein VMT95_09805 [Candidatus Binatia bacterium]|nr:hypothetical protein [Candidatus Binatia bacterium]
MKLYSYVIARDFGFAPNPFYGFCTLATCKPRIRKGASIGDWIVGTGSTKYDLHGHLVYAMRVTEDLAFDDYWSDPRFVHKRPNLRGSLKQWFGDNIYHRNPRTGRWIQENSHHSRGTGRPFKSNIDHDTQTDRVLISDDFVYFGGSAPRIPAPFRTGNKLWKNGASHKGNFTDAYIERVVEWLRSLGSWGCVGDPAEFAKIKWA